MNFFQPSFKLKEKRREGAKVIKRYHPPATPYERALAHPKLAQAIKRRRRETYRTLDPVQLLAEIRAAQEELGERIGKRGLAPADPLAFARSLGTTATITEVRATHRRPKRRYKKRIRMPSKLDPYLATRTGLPSSRRSLRWPSCAGSPQSILRRSATGSIRAFSACFDPSGKRWRRRSSHPRQRNQ